jgi:5-methylcytosine-specific restriction endonuclease McrA
MASKPRLGALPSTKYRLYIQSDAWRAKRELYFASNLPQFCWGCDVPKKSGFHMHHKTYKNLGVEKLTDLILLCPDCHQTVHTLHKTPKYQKKGLHYATRDAIRISRKARNLHSNVYKSPRYRQQRGWK